MVNESLTVLKGLLSGGSVSYQAIFSKAFRSIPIGVYLSQMYFWQENSRYKSKETHQQFDGKMFICRTSDEWFEETGMTTEQQIKARETMRSFGVLLEKKAGMPAKLWQHIDVDTLVTVIYRYMETGLPVTVDHRNKVRYFTRASDGKILKQGTVNHRNTYIESIESLESIGRERETALPLSAGPSESENPHSEPKEKNAPLIAPPPPFLPTPPMPDLPAPGGPLVSVVFAPPTVGHIPIPGGPSVRVETHPPAEVKTIRQTRQKPTLQKKTVEIPLSHAEISPLLNELLEKRPYLQKSHDALRREMEWFFSKPVAFCREHIQCSLDRSSGVWDSLKFSGVEETFLRWQRTQERIATPAQQAGPARPSYGPPPTPQRLEPPTVNKKYRSIRDL